MLAKSRRLLESFAGADPVFPVGGDVNPSGGRQDMILPKFPKNCIKLRQFWAARGRGSATDLLDEVPVGFSGVAFSKDPLCD